MASGNEDLKVLFVYCPSQTSHLPTLCYIVRSKSGFSTVISLNATVNEYFSSERQV